MLHLSGLKRLKRDKRRIFFGIYTTSQIKNWKLEIQSSSTSSEGLIVSFSDIHNTESQEYELEEPRLVTSLPVSGDDEEHVVFFIDHNDHLPFYIEQVLYKIDQFEKIIDNNYKSSKNSTKILRKQSLRDIIINIVDKELPRNKWASLAGAISQYIVELITQYPYLGYLPVSERIEYRGRYLGDQVFAWEMYLRYFYEQWSINPNNIDIPPLNKEYFIEAWAGDFFDRANPVWGRVLYGKSKVRLPVSKKSEIYYIWKNLINRHSEL